jgi:MoxR-like ATPase
LFNSARAYALVCGRDYVLPDDIKYLLIPTLAHRIVSTTGRHEYKFAEQFLHKIAQEVPVPI